MAKKQFKAESKRLLDLMINSIYTHKEIFLREIISNASDAIDKLCYISLTDDKVGLDRGDYRIFVRIDEEARTITVSDNGVGMTKENMEENLGVIAKSGSYKFKNEMDGEGASDADIDIIGQFGVGFYSAFMVADKVVVLSKAYDSQTAYKWESTGTDGYTIEECEKDTAGSDVIIHVKADSEDEKYGEYLSDYKLRGLIKKYSDYIRWPIVMETETFESRETGEKNEDGTNKTETVSVKKDETVNSMVPIWQRSRSEVTDKDCAEFYKEKFRDMQDPLSVVRVNAEGTVSYKAMLFIPSSTPHNYYSKDFQPGLQLYSSGVLIMEQCADLLPECFRFVRGIVDSPDLSLNISREVLQHDRQLRVIAASIEKKIAAELKNLLDDKEKYASFWRSFGRQIKYGIVNDFGAKKDLLQDLLVYPSSHGEELVSLSEYANMMPEGQKFIYYAAAESKARAQKLPQTEQVIDAGYNLLYMTDEVDSFVVSIIGTYGEKEFCNVSVDELGLETDLQKADTEKKQEENKDLLDFIKDSLDGAVVDVTLSHKLKTHPVCLTTTGDVTLEVEKYFSAISEPGTEKIKAQKVLELNGDHAAFAALQRAFEQDKEKAAQMAKILLCQAQLIADIPLEDPSDYAEMVCGLF